MPHLLLRRGGLGGDCGGRALECFGANNSQVHQTGIRDSGVAPAGHRRRLHIAKASHHGGATEAVDEVGVWVFFGHSAPIIRHALFFVKERLTQKEGMPTSIAIRIAE